MTDRNVGRQTVRTKETNKQTSQKDRQKEIEEHATMQMLTKSWPHINTHKHAMQGDDPETYPDLSVISSATEAWYKLK